MRDEDKTREQLIAELSRARERVAELKMPSDHFAPVVTGERGVDLVAHALQHAPCGAVVASTEPNGEVFYVNDEFTRITGYTHDDLPTVADWLERAYPDEDHRARILAVWARDVAEPGRDLITHVTRADGDVRPILLRTAHLPRRRMVVTLLDVGDLQRIEKELRESEERLRQIAETIDQVFWIVQVEPFAVLYASPAFEEIWDRPVEDLLADGHLWSAPMHQEDAARVMATWDACLGGRLPIWREEYRIRRPDGEIRWIEDSGAAVLDGAGEIYRVTGVAKDITVRKQAETERREMEQRVHFAQKMESLGVLAGGVAHDFNNLLMGILGNADLAMLELPDGAPAQIHLAGIEHAARRAADLARQLLAYSGKGKFVVDKLDLTILAEDIAHLMDATIARRAELRIAHAIDVPAIEGDATQIRQVIMNLITNAADAIGEGGGTITLSTGTLLCDPDFFRETYFGDELPAGTYAYLEVADTGVGMDRETRSRIFEPFFSTKFTGRGLGLAAVLGIVKGHRGALKVWSEPGAGTTFRVLFPAVESSASSMEESLSLETGEFQGVGTILLVDDEPMVREVAEAMLIHGGYDVIAAETGRRAVELFAERGDDIDCVLLDLAMPDMDGLETFRALRAEREDVRVLLSSGYSEQDALTRFGGKKLAGFLQKPYHASTLLDAVQQILRKKG